MISPLYECLVTVYPIFCKIATLDFREKDCYDAREVRHLKDCNSCTGNCASCGGCGGCPGNVLELTEAEVDFLKLLAQIPFLPVVRKADDPTPVYPENGNLSRETCSLVLRCLEKKGLISLDFDKPLKNRTEAGWEAYPIQGSMALTARGQTVVELMEMQGIRF